MSYRLFDELFTSVKSQKTRKLVIVGTKETYEAINRYLQLKTESGFSVSKYFNINEIKPEALSNYLNKSGNGISMILVEDKNFLSPEETKHLTDRNISIVNEKEFFNAIL